jgi:hypothetical protein
MGQKYFASAVRNSGFFTSDEIIQMLFYYMNPSIDTVLPCRMVSRREEQVW